jgi:hypothetical protein
MASARRRYARLARLWGREAIPRRVRAWLKVPMVVPILADRSPGLTHGAGGFAVRWLNQRVLAFSTTAATEWF